jgi:hypothetical protein
MMEGMTKRLKTKLEIKSWDEKPYREFDDGRKLARAHVELQGTEEGAELDATWEAVLYYAADGTSTYVGQMEASGRLGDRSGSFVMQGNGTFDGTRARIESIVVPGSGTDGLAGLTGKSVHVSTHDDYPFWPITIEYDIA